MDETDKLCKDGRDENMDNGHRQNDISNEGPPIGLPLTETVKHRIALQQNINELKRMDKTLLKTILPEMQEKCCITEQELLFLKEQDQLDGQSLNELLFDIMSNKLDFEIKSFLNLIKSDSFGVCIAECIEDVVDSCEPAIYECVYSQDEIIDMIAKLDSDVSMAIKYNAKLAVMEPKNEIVIKLQTVTIPDNSIKMDYNQLKNNNILSGLLVTFCDISLMNMNNKTQDNPCDMDTMLKALASSMDSNEGMFSPSKCACSIIKIISEDLVNFEKVVFQQKAKVRIREENENSCIVVEIYDRFYCHVLKEDFVSGKLSDRIALWLRKKKIQDLVTNQTLVLMSDLSHWEMVENNTVNDMANNSTVGVSFPACYSHCQHSSTWYWTLDLKSWIPVSQNTVNGGLYSGLTPSKTDQMILEYLCSCEELEIENKDFCLPCIQKLYAVSNEENISIKEVNDHDSEENNNVTDEQKHNSEEENQSQILHKSVQTVLLAADIVRLQNVPKPQVVFVNRDVKTESTSNSSQQNNNVNSLTREGSKAGKESETNAEYVTPPSSPSADQKTVAFKLPENSPSESSQSNFQRAKSRSFKARKKLPNPPPPPPPTEVDGSTAPNPPPPPPVDGSTTPNPPLPPVICSTAPNPPPPPIDGSTTPNPPLPLVLCYTAPNLPPPPADSSKAPVPPPPPLPRELASLSIPPVAPPPPTFPPNSTVSNGGSVPPPPPIPPPRGGNKAVPPPPPLGGLTPKRQVNRPEVKTKSPMKPLFWKKITINDIEMRRQSGDKSKSIWEEIKDIDIDIDNLDEQFAQPTLARSQSVRRKDPKTRTQAKESTRLLEPNRSQNVAIFKTSLRVSLEEIETYLMKGDTEKLTLGLLEQLYDLVKDEEEIKLIKEHKESHPNDVLDVSEQFLYDLSRIPAFTNKCFWLYFTFQKRVDKVTYQLKSIKQAAQTLIEADSIKTVLGILLMVGNYMNGGSAMGQADGFSLDILPKVIYTKSRDRNTNLLQFVASQYVRVKGKSSSLPSHEQIRKAASVNLEEIDNEYTEIERELEKCEKKVSITKSSQQDEQNLFYQKMKNFIKEAKKDLDTLQSHMAETRSAFHKCTCYFAAESQSTEIKPMEFFKMWADFCSDFNELLKKKESTTNGKPPTEPKVNKENPPTPKPRGSKKQPTIPEDQENTEVPTNRDSVKALATKLAKTGLQLGKNNPHNKEKK